MTLQTYLGKLAAYASETGPVDDWHLSHKPTHRCLTVEGYPLGTECWYVFVAAHGRRMWFGAGSAEDATRQAVEWLEEAP